MAYEITRRDVLGLGAAALSSAFVPGCRSSELKKRHVYPADVPGPSGPPVRGGTLVFSDLEAVPSVQNQRLSSFSSMCLTWHTNVFVLYFDPYQKTFEPWVAESWGKNPENTAYWFKIRKGITFSDGSELTPNIVAKNLDRFGRGDDKHRIPVHAFIARGYDHVEVHDDIVKVVLSKPNQQFLRDLTRMNSGLVGEKTLALDLEEAGDPMNHVGAGPFVYTSHVPGEQTSFARRRGFAWAPRSSPNQGEAYLDEIIWKALPEVGLRTGALTSNQVDIAHGIQPSDEPLILERGYQLLYYRPPFGTCDYFSLRVENELTKDIRVRQALLHSVDHARMTREALSPSYPPPISILNVNNNNVVDLRHLFRYEPDKSRDLLEQAGWARGPDGIRRKHDKKLRLTVPHSLQQVALGPAWEFLTLAWRKELGIELEIRKDPAFAAQANQDPNVPITLGRTSVCSLGQALGGPGNTALLGSPPELVALYKRELAAKDEAEFRQVQIEQQQAILEGAYAVPYFEEAQTYGVSPNVHVTFQIQTPPDFHNAWKKA
ncbi:MAG: ABC transporter substrate-binding protein [Polyangiales bacterium]